MKTILTVVKKEFARFFKDIRLMITAIILPGLLIFAVYSIMGSIMQSVQESETEQVPTAYFVNLPQSQTNTLAKLFEVKQDCDEQEALEAVKKGKLDLLVIFPADFDEAVAAYQPSSLTQAPNVKVYYNAGEERSQKAYFKAVAYLDEYESLLANKFDVNYGEDGNVADSQSIMRSVMSSVVPMVLLMLLYSGCMAVAPESIAGEKERGTIATLLVTPVKRSTLAIGKIIALSVIALMSGLSSTLGLVLSLPRLAGVSGGISLAIFTFGDIVALLAIILSVVLVMVTLISIISAFAKSVKEASGLVVPIMILVMLCGIFSIFASGISPVALSFVPILNSAICISSIISGVFNVAAFAITICVNVAFTALLVVVLALMFNSEKIMFNK